MVKVYFAFLFILVVGSVCTVEAQVAFRDVSVLSFDPAMVTGGQTVVVQGGEITRIGPADKVRLSESLQVVEARGKLLMPGMMDAHAHLPGPQGLEMPMKDYLLLQLAHGVTSLRVARYEPEFLELRKTIESEGWVSPRLFLPGPTISRNVAPIEKPIESFRKYKAAGYDHIKYLSGLTRAEHEVCILASHRAGLPFFGHFLPHLDLNRTIELRPTGIEHLQGFTTLYESGKLDELKETISRVAQRKIFLCPTASWYNGYTLNFEDPDQEFRSRRGLNYLPTSLLKSWDEWLVRRKTETIKGDRKVREKILPLLVDSGVPMLLSPGDGYFFVPGLAMLTEMRVYAAAGFTNGEILKAATFNGADFYEQTSKFGNVKEGLRSDLVLLGGNPLEDLDKVRDIEGVMLGDRWFPKADLQSELEKMVAARKK